MKNDLSDLLKNNYELRQENIKLKRENAELKKEVKRLGNALSFANNKIKNLENQIEQINQNQNELVEKLVNKAVTEVVNKLTKEHQEEVNKLNAKIKLLESKLNINSTNSNTPTSKEAIGKHTIQNNREKSDNTKGGQTGHKQHKLNYFKEEEITNKVEHTLDKCPKCGGSISKKNVVISDIYDINVTITKTRNYINNYYCSCCHKNISANDRLPRGASYGDNINSIALSMMNEANTPLNKVSSFLSGISNNEINLSEGYLIKLQRKAANELTSFVKDLNNKICNLSIVHWDDTVCKFGLEKPEEGFDDDDKKNLENKESDSNIRNGVIRFYGDNNWALLIGHRTKNKETIEKDGILPILPNTCTVIHDHLLLNYNDKFSFKNAECNEHTKRYLKKNIEMFPEHSWAKELKNLLISTNEERNQLMTIGVTSFEESKLAEISSKYDSILENGFAENEKVSLEYIKNKIDEQNLLERLSKFKENHLMFAYDFSVDFTNNTAERGLRQVKRKLAVSFMFKNANRMKNYADILSYLETCYRHGISRYNAAKRLVQKNPFTVDELDKSEKN